MLAVVLSFGSSRLKTVLQYFFFIIFSPLKLLDFVFAHIRGAEECASGVHVVLRVPEAS